MCRRRPFFSLGMGFVIFLSAFPLMAESAKDAQEMISIDSPLYPLLLSVFREAGKVLPQRSFPISRAQMRAWLATIDGTKLSSEGLAALQHLIASDGGRVNLVEEGELTLSLEATIGLEASVPAQNGLDPVRDFADRLPLIGLPINVGITNNLFLQGDFNLQEEALGPSRDSLDWRWSNIPADLGYLDAQLPFRTYGALGGDFWSVVIGRDQLQMGPGEKRQMIISDEAQYYDHLRLRLFFPSFGYEFTLISLETALVNDAGETTLNRDTIDPSVTDAATVPERWYLNHRFDFRFLDDKVRLTLNEGLMVAGQSLQLGYFSPFGILHSFMNWLPSQNAWGGQASSLMSLELAVVPWQYVEVYGQVLWNQFTLAIENESDMPGAFGYNLGLAMDVPLAGGYLNAGAEWAQADPWLYLRETPWKSYVWRRKAHSRLSDTGTYAVVEKPMGYAWGPDSTGLNVWLGWQPSDARLGVSLTWELVYQGENNFASAWHTTSAAQTGSAAVALRSPSGTPEIHNVITLEGRWLPLQWLNLEGGLIIHAIDQYQHQLGQSRFSMEPWLGVTCNLARLVANPEL